MTLPKAHPTKWRVIFHGKSWKLYDTQGEAEAAAEALNLGASTDALVAFSQPPLEAWGGKFMTDAEVEAIHNHPWPVHRPPPKR